MNGIATRVSADLHYSQPSGITARIYADQLLYGGLSEWVRTITADVDPLLGNSKTGVTREYLEDRAAIVLRDMSYALLDSPADRDTCLAQSRWVIRAMLELDELWCPDAGLVACSLPDITYYSHGYARILGQREPSIAPVIQSGLCHFRKAVETPEVIQAFEGARLSRESALASYLPRLAHRFLFEPDLIAGKVVSTYPTKRVSGGVIVRASLDKVPFRDKMFILSHCWPAMVNALSWDICDHWFLPLRFCPKA